MAAIAAAGGGAVSAASAIQQGQDAVAISRYNYNNDVNSANLAVQQGNEESRRSLVNSNKVIGQGEAAAGASGITTSGSALNVIGNSAAQGELNALTIQHQAALKAYGFANQAILEPFKQQIANTNAQMGAAGALIGASAKAYSYSGSGGSGGDSGGGGSDD